MSTFGSAVLGPIGMEGSIGFIDAQAVRNTSFFIISNSDKDSWLTIENRCNVAIFYCPTDNNSSTGIYSTGERIPALSKCSIAVDPDHDILICLGSFFEQFNMSFANFGSNVNNANLSFMPRRANITYNLMPHGSRFTEPLYPIESCLVLSRLVLNSAAGGAPKFTVDPSNYPGNVNLITPQFPPGPVNLSNLDPADLSIMAIAFSMVNLAATATADNVIPMYTLGGGNYYDLPHLGESAAGGTITAPYPNIIHIPGAPAIIVSNQNGGANPTVSYEISFWIGYAGQLTQGLN